MPDGTEEQIMLTLTDSAVTAIRNLTSQPELPDETGLRIMSQEEGGPAFQVTLAAVALDDKSLDAQVDEEGTVAFTLAEQAV
jgi:iron-sulfur cluster assembly protein